MAERTRQHREMRLKGNAELKERVEELKLKLQTERERMQKDFEGQVRVLTHHVGKQTYSSALCAAAIFGRQAPCLSFLCSFRSKIALGVSTDYEHTSAVSVAPCLSAKMRISYHSFKFYDSPLAATRHDEGKIRCTCVCL